MEEVKTRRVARDESRWVVLLVYVLQYILMLTLSFWRLSVGAELWKLENSKASMAGGAWSRGRGEHQHEVWSTQVRLVLPEFCLKSSLCLIGKAMLGGRSRSVERDPRAGACSEFEELEGAAR